MKECKHQKGHIVNANVIGLEDQQGRFMLELSVECAECKTPFRFIGLPAGLDLNGAAVSVDAQEGRFAIAPADQVVSELEGGVVGFSVRKKK